MNLLHPCKTVSALCATLVLWTLSFDAFAQCEADESTLIVDILTDSYPGETSWEVTLDGAVVLTGGPYDEGDAVYADTLCIPASEEPCIQFEIFDSFGDGMCCGYGEGQYVVTLDGQTMASGGDFGESAATGPRG